MRTTNNLGLKKPEGTDIVDIADLNGNMDTLDSAVKSLQDQTAASVPLTQKGAANGVATLDASAKLPAGQLPGTAVQATTADITYYVRTDGNDGNNGLANTAAGAFRTIGKAISMIPPVVNHSITINVAAGTYNENLGMGGISGSGVISFNPSINDLSQSCNIQSFDISGCSVKVSVKGFNALTAARTAFTAISCTNAEFLYCSASASTTQYHGLVSTSSKVYCYTCSFSNKYVGIYGGQNSEVFAWSCVGSGNAVGIMGAEAGSVVLNGNALTGTIPTASQNGGSVSSYGVLNPWGDNTTGSRPFVSASHTSQQTISSANSWLRVICGAESNDNLGNYDTSTGLFTCPTAGMYLVNAAAEVSNAVTGDELKLAVGSDAAVLLNVDHQRPGSSGYQQLSGSAIIVASANAKLAMWVTSSRGGTTTNPDGYYTYMQVIKIA